MVIRNDLDPKLNSGLFKQILLESNLTVLMKVKINKKELIPLWIMPMVEEDNAYRIHWFLKILVSLLQDLGILHIYMNL